MKAVQKRRSYWADGLMVLIAAGIIYATLLYAPSGSAGPWWTDKAFHFGAFFLLVFPGALVHRRAIYWLIPLAILFGALIELVQPYVGRGRELNDLIADALGVFCGIFAGALIRRWRN